MEQFPHPYNSNQNEEPPVVENPFFFEKKTKGRYEEYVEKRSLQNVAKQRWENEDYSKYHERMERSFNYALKRLPDAAESLRQFQVEKNKKKESGGKRVDARRLLPVVELQNKLVSVLADLEPRDRDEYIIKSRVSLGKWLKENQVDDEIASKMRTMFDGCESVCDYMDMRKEEKGESVDFYTDVFLDWKYGIDLVEFDKRDDGALDVRLVQNKSSHHSEAAVVKDRGRHAAWVEEELMGMHNVRDRFSEVVEAEIESGRVGDLRGALAESFADSALAALEIARAGGVESGGEEDPKTREFLKNESKLSRLAYALSFQGEEGVSSLHSTLAQEVVRQEGDDLFSHVPVSRIYSVYAVKNEMPVPPYLLYSEKKEGKELFVGTEQDV